MTLRALLFAGLLVSGCSAPKAAQLEVAPASMSEGPCASARGASGQVVSTPDNAQLWYDLRGPKDAPALVFLHGGPGYNTYSFAKAVGSSLEATFRVLYLDQRGCGRSYAHGAGANLGMAATVDDIAWLQRRLGLGPLNLIGHSFGGAVALEFARRYPEHTGKVILVDTTNDFGAALNHQLAISRSNAERFGDKAAAVREIADKDGPALQRLGELYALVGRLPLQRQIHFATDVGQQKMERDDAESGLLSCRSGDAVAALVKEGWLEGALPAHALDEGKGILFAGRHSEAIGRQNIESASNAWNVPVHWFEESGHFVFVEEPEHFVEQLKRFVSMS